VSASPSEVPASGSPLDEHASPVAEGTGRQGRATASLILGIIAVLAALLIPILGWLLAAIGITLGATARSEARRRGMPHGRATAGIVLGIVAVLLGVASVVLAVSLR
jgi:hypothetical protein